MSHPFKTAELEHVKCEQNTPEWYAARLGVVTASSFKDVLAKGQGKTRASYMRTKAYEIISGRGIESFSNSYTERGHAQEPEARAMYAAVIDEDVATCGFYKRGRIGCSPDALVGKDGMAQIKTMRGDLLLEYLEKGTMPSEHKAQVQGEIFVSGRRWSDFIGYCPGLPLLRVRVQRDDEFCATLALELELFIGELDDYVRNIRNKYRLEN